MSDTGPIYGVELISVLPMNHGQTAGMNQAMPSRDDLVGIKDYRQGRRVVAGYEVLLNHWRAQADEIERLQLQTQLQADELRRRQIRIVALESGND